MRLTGLTKVNASPTCKSSIFADLKQTIIDFQKSIRDGLSERFPSYAEFILTAISGRFGELKTLLANDLFGSFDSPKREVASVLDFDWVGHALPIVWRLVQDCLRCLKVDWFLPIATKLVAYPSFGVGSRRR